MGCPNSSLPLLPPEDAKISTLVHSPQNPTDTVQNPVPDPALEHVLPGGKSISQLKREYEVTKLTKSNDEKVTPEPNNGKIYHSYRDVWACYHCKVKADRFAMEGHNCSGSLKK
ncbi:MAG: hypothetical protein WBL44_05230 [Nitrososphaeraceae archaeon]|jgi:hypothetical protein